MALKIMYTFIVAMIWPIKWKKKTKQKQNKQKQKQNKKTKQNKAKQNKKQNKKTKTNKQTTTKKNTTLYGMIWDCLVVLPVSIHIKVPFET